MDAARLRTEPCAFEPAAGEENGRMHDLVVVMPVYNEAACIRSVVASWLRVLDGLGADYRLLILDDGSTDGTRESLAAFANFRRVEVSSSPINRGHGPTILAGYRKAVSMAEWVFQCDSDDEIPPDPFVAFWSDRKRFDALLGQRESWGASWTRRWVSGLARQTVRLATGVRLRDVNTPFRLIRSDVLRPVIEPLPPCTFSPNLVLTCALLRSGARVRLTSVPYRYRRTGRVSLRGGRLLKGVWCSLWEVLRYGLRQPRCATRPGELTES